jgi:plasmid stabilization system protein ParE
VPAIVKRPRARSDLAEIWDYIADDSEARADAFVKIIDQKFKSRVDEGSCLPSPPTDPDVRD